MNEIKIDRINWRRFKNIKQQDYFTRFSFRTHPATTNKVVFMCCGCPPTSSSCVIIINRIERALKFQREGNLAFLGRDLESNWQFDCFFCNIFILFSI